MNEYEGFCHRHPAREKNLNLDENHVIIDRADWEKVREMNLNMTCVFCGKKIRENQTKGVYLNSNWVCNGCKEDIEKGKMKNERNKNNL